MSHEDISRHEKEGLGGARKGNGRHKNGNGSATGPEAGSEAGPDVGSDAGAGAETIDAKALFATLLLNLRMLIQHGVPEPDRSSTFHSVVGLLAERGLEGAQIKAVLGVFPQGIAEKFAKRLAEEVDRSLGNGAGAIA